MVIGDMNQDPSMEEILASIKRVIAEDSKAPAPAARTRRPRAAPEPPPPSDPDDVLELSDPVVEEDRLTSENATAVTRQSLAALAALKQAQEHDHPEAPRAGEGPLEAVVRDMLRPLLKEWLEHRLPDMVEEMVAREIARITGKGL
jgi:uncharacterized protein